MSDSSFIPRSARHTSTRCGGFSFKASFRSFGQCRVASSMNEKACLRYPRRERDSSAGNMISVDRRRSPRPNKSGVLQKSHIQVGWSRNRRFIFLNGGERMVFAAKKVPMFSSERSGRVAWIWLNSTFEEPCEFTCKATLNDCEQYVPFRMLRVPFQQALQ